MDDLKALALRRVDGLVTFGIALGRAREAIRAGDGFFRGALSWNEIAGSGAEVSADDLHRAIRRTFAWEDFIRRSATGLASFGFSFRAAVVAQRRLLELAIADSWPAEIEEAQVLIEEARRTSTPASTASERGLLWMITNALEDPWEIDASERLSGVAAERRFARFAMIATGMTSIPSHLLPPDSSTHVEGSPLPTTTALLGDGRLAERDVLIRWLVRAVEIYDELLPEVIKGARTAFEAKRGLSLRTWIVKTISLANLVEQQMATGALRCPELDMRNVPVEHKDNPMLAIIHSMAASKEVFAGEIRSTRSRADDQTLALEAIRRYPILDLENGRFLVLHKDFIAAASDDGVWYTLYESLGASFGSSFGIALERYVERVLRRCAVGPAHGFARVPESSRAGVLRCDFAWRYQDDLFLIDAKRAGLSSAHLMGSTDAGARLVEQVGHACAQIASTHRGVEAGELDDTIALLGVPPGWRPRQTIPLVITHRPVFMFFSSPEMVLQQRGVIDDWAARFSAWPTVWSLSDLELFEAALPTIDLSGFVRSAVERAPITMCGVPPYLTAVSYVGPTASNYFDEQRHAILEAFTDT